MWVGGGERGGTTGPRDRRVRGRGCVQLRFLQMRSVDAALTRDVGGGCGCGGGHPMLGLVVSAQVNLPLEGATALLAGEGFEARVLAAVGDEVGGLRESLATLSAYIWLFT